MHQLGPILSLAPLRIGGGTRIEIRFRGASQMRVAFLAFVLFSLSAWAVGQHNCPEGFGHVGTLPLTGSYGESEEWRELTLPEGATLLTPHINKPQFVRGTGTLPRDQT